MSEPTAPTPRRRWFRFSLRTLFGLVTVVALLMGGFGTGSDSMRYRLDSHYTDYISLTPNTLASIMLTVDSEFDKLEQSIASTGENKG